jgi:hypothetical protein
MSFLNANYETLSILFEALFFIFYFGNFKHFL